jgi:hypothetical protein
MWGFIAKYSIFGSFPSVAITWKGMLKKGLEDNQNNQEIYNGTNFMKL